MIAHRCHGGLGLIYLGVDILILYREYTHSDLSRAGSPPFISAITRGRRSISLGATLVVTPIPGRQTYLQLDEARYHHIEETSSLGDGIRPSCLAVAV